MKQSKLTRIAAILFGNCIYAVAVTYFILPANLITGGSTGIALFVQRYTGLPISLFVSAFNICAFGVGAILLGKRFALTTLLSTFTYPLFLFVLERVAIWTGPFTTDVMLCAIFGGFMIGAGIALVVQNGASTGGMDIPPLIIQKYTGIPVSVSLCAFDIIILLMQFTFTDRERILYGILLVALYSVILDRFLLSGKSKVEVKIISEEYLRINSTILHQFDRGTTLLEAQGGYSRKDAYAVLAVVNKRELFKLTEMVQALDPAAFIIITQVNEVRGRGFTSSKKYGI